MKAQFLTTPAIILTFTLAAAAADYRVEPLHEGPPTDQLSSEVAAQISATGVKVIRGTKSTLCEIWPCKQWDVKPGFHATPALLYPFHPGQLVGVIRYRRRGSDFRDQDMARGLYTLRYALQPVDGNHEGTSPTRDFLLMVKAEDDKSAKPMGTDQLNELSAEAAETNHPAMLCLQEAHATDDAKPSMLHNEDRDWWIVRFTGKAAAGGKTSRLPVEVIVVGVAE